MNALSNAIYDIERFGLHIVASPRHADMLLVTGPVTRNMEHALRQTYDATPAPKLVVAMGACAFDGGIFRDSYAVLEWRRQRAARGRLHTRLPARPEAIIQGIMLALDKMKIKIVFYFTTMTVQRACAYDVFGNAADEHAVDDGLAGRAHDDRVRFYPFGRRQYGLVGAAGLEETGHINAFIHGFFLGFFQHRHARLDRFLPVIALLRADDVNDKKRCAHSWDANSMA